MIKTLTLAFLTLCFALFFNGVKKQSSKVLWIACYGSTHKLHFMNIDRYAGSKSCSGSMSLKGPKGYSLIRNSSRDMFSPQIAGTKRTVSLKNGRRLSVSQWKRKGRKNVILVAEPNFKTGKLKKHCTIRNARNAYATRFNRKINRFQVQVTPSKSKKAKAVWKNCAL